MKRSERAVYGLLAVLFVYAAWRATSRAWACDDAFISYRYADNLARGLGLVFNPGERVEGYTNFLYTLTLAGGVALGASPIPLSHVIGIVSYFAVAAILVVWSKKRRKREAPWIPLGACLWLVQDDLHTWATGGLETTMFAAFALAGLAVLAIPEERKRSHLLAGGVLVALACTVRPDGVLFAIVALAAPVFLRPRSRAIVWREIAAIGAPLVVIGAAFVAWKLAYYGRLLPTAFHAKSASEGRWEQGLVYVGLYFAKHWSTALAALVLPALAVVQARARGERDVRRDAWLAAAAFAVFTVYVVRSSGDYMFARRLVPALPFLFVVLDAAADVIDGPVPAVSAVVLAGALLPFPVLPDEPGARVRGIGDERLFYPDEVVEMRRAQAAVAKDVFAGRRVRAGFGGGMCMFAYFSGLPELVEPNGLTQYWIAEEGEDVLGRIGHKGVSRDRLRAHGVRWIFHNDAPPIPPSDRFDEMVVLGVLRVEILAYDDALMASLARDPRVTFKPIADVLREAEADVKQMSCADARATHDALAGYYLASHPDEDARFRRVIDEVCARGR